MILDMFLIACTVGVDEAVVDGSMDDYEASIANYRRPLR